MTDTAVTHGIPEHPTDLPPGYVPFDACEGDFEAMSPQGRVVARRLRMIRIKAEDGNHLNTLVEDLGPATEEDSVYIPCEGAVEMAHVHELLDQAIRNRKKRSEFLAQILPTRHEMIRLGLLEYAQKAILAKAGTSTFGQYQRTERTSY